jgi:hypothetical protein
MLTFERNWSQRDPHLRDVVFATCRETDTPDLDSRVCGANAMECLGITASRPAPAGDAAVPAVSVSEPRIAGAVSPGSRVGVVVVSGIA